MKLFRILFGVFMMLAGLLLAGLTIFWLPVQMDPFDYILPAIVALLGFAAGLLALWYALEECK